MRNAVRTALAGGFDLHKCTIISNISGKHDCLMPEGQRRRKTLPGTYVHSGRMRNLNDCFAFCFAIFPFVALPLCALIVCSCHGRVERVLITVIASCYTVFRECCTEWVCWSPSRSNSGFYVYKLFPYHRPKTALFLYISYYAIQESITNLIKFKE